MGAGNIFVPGVIDQGPHVLYHRLTAAAAAALNGTLQFFNQTKGANGGSITNLSNANRIPGRQNFHVHAIGFIFSFRMDPIDVNAIMRNAFFELKIGSQTYADGLLQLFPGGGGASGWAATTVAALSLTGTNNGVPAPSFMRRWGPEWARTIEPGIDFGVDLRFDTAVNLQAAPAIGLDLICVLDGIRDRAAQG